MMQWLAKTGQTLAGKMTLAFATLMSIITGGLLLVYALLL